MRDGLGLLGLASAKGATLALSRSLSTLHFYEMLGNPPKGQTGNVATHPLGTTRSAWQDLLKDAPRSQSWPQTLPLSHVTTSSGAITARNCSIPVKGSLCTAGHSHSRPARWDTCIHGREPDRVICYLVNQEDGAGSLTGAHATTTAINSIC